MDVEKAGIRLAIIALILRLSLLVVTSATVFPKFAVP